MTTFSRESTGFYVVASQGATYPSFGVSTNGVVKVSTSTCASGTLASVAYAMAIPVRCNDGVMRYIPLLLSVT